MVHAVVAAIRAPLQHLPEVSSLSGSRLLRWLRRQRAGLLQAATPRCCAATRCAWLSTLGSALGAGLGHTAPPAA
jgi:hypothetical protein